MTLFMAELSIYFDSIAKSLLFLHVIMQHIEGLFIKKALFDCNMQTTSNVQIIFNASVNFFGRKCSNGNILNREF